MSDNGEIVYIDEDIYFDTRDDSNNASNAVRKEANSSDHNELVDFYDYYRKESWKGRVNDKITNRSNCSSDKINKEASDEEFYETFDEAILPDSIKNISADSSDTIVTQIEQTNNGYEELSVDHTYPGKTEEIHQNSSIVSGDRDRTSKKYRAPMIPSTIVDTVNDSILIPTNKSNDPSKSSNPFELYDDTPLTKIDVLLDDDKNSCKIVPGSIIYKTSSNSNEIQNTLKTSTDKVTENNISEVPHQQFNNVATPDKNAESSNKLSNVGDLVNSNNVTKQLDTVIDELTLNKSSEQKSPELKSDAPVNDSENLPNIEKCKIIGDHDPVEKIFIAEADKKSEVKPHNEPIQDNPCKNDEDTMRNGDHNKASSDVINKSTVAAIDNGNQNKYEILGEISLQDAAVNNQEKNTVVPEKQSMEENIPEKPVNREKPPRPAPRRSKTREIVYKPTSYSNTNDITNHEIVYKPTSYSNTNDIANHEKIYFPDQSNDNEYDLDSSKAVNHQPIEQENIYAEINDDPNLPQPKPRMRKLKKSKDQKDSRISMSTQCIYNGSVGSVVSQTSQRSIPDWLHHRAPIPSPRKSRQGSRQTSLDRKLPMEPVRNYPGNDNSDNRLSIRRSDNLHIDEFYSGKSASIAYGMTSNINNSPHEESVPQKHDDVNPYEQLKKTNINQLFDEEVYPKAATRYKPCKNKTSGNPFGDDSNSESSTVNTPEIFLSKQEEISKNPFGADYGTVPVPFEEEKRRKRKRKSTIELQRIDENVVTAQSAYDNEALLCHALYCIHHTMGSQSGVSTWPLHQSKLGPDLAVGQSPPPTEVSFQETRQELMNIFGVDENTFAKCLEAAKSLKGPELKLELEIHEARNLREKSISGSANAFVTSSVPGDSRRTRVISNSRHPKWSQRLDMRIRDLRNDTLRLNVWHEHECLGVDAVRHIRDLKGLGRLVKGCHDDQMLGGVCLPLRNIPEKGLTGWFTLTKEETANLSGSNMNLNMSHSNHNLSATSPTSPTSPISPTLKSPYGKTPKSRGEIYVSLDLKSSKLSPSLRDPYSSLLSKTIEKYIGSNSSFSTPWMWTGGLPVGAMVALNLVAVVQGSSQRKRNLALLNVILCGLQSKGAGETDTPSLHGVKNVTDTAWLLEVTKAVLEDNQAELEAEEEKLLETCVAAWLVSAEANLSSLDSVFDPSTVVVAKAQLASTLGLLRFISSNSLSRKILVKLNKENVHEMVTKSVEKCIITWWKGLLERELKDVSTPEQQVERVIRITEQSHRRIQEAATLYSPVFVSNLGFPYLRIMYLFITKKLNPCVRPLLMTIYDQILSNSSRTDDENQDAFNAGTNLWQLYINLGRIHKQGELMPQEIRNESGVRDYHRWFSKGVMHWLKVAQARTRRIISHAVEADSLAPCDQYCSTGSSATDAITVITGVQQWWEELCWPDPVDGGVILGKILEDLCGSATHYCDMIRHKVDAIYRCLPRDARVFVTEEICVGLNNIERVRDEVSCLLERFSVDAYLAKIDQPHAGVQFRGTFERLISSAVDNMESKITEFVETVVAQTATIISGGLTAACEAGSSAPLLEEVMDPGVGLMRRGLRDHGFIRFLGRFWDELLVLLKNLVVRNADKKPASYFAGVQQILAHSLQFFTPSGGLERSQAVNDEYTSLLDLLGDLCLPSEALIAHYYGEREEERHLPGVKSRGELFLTVFFTEGGKLVVEVVMVRDMCRDDDTTSVGSHGILSRGPEPISSYVKIQLVPVDWFPSGQAYATKVLKRCDPATFQETFTYVLSASDTNVSDGFLLFTVKDHNLARSNTFLGEAVVSLASVPTIASDAISCQPRPLQLKLTRPAIIAGYRSLNGLRMRASSDKVATAFLKKLAARIPDVGKRNILRPSSAGDDGDKMSKSPSILDKIIKR